MCAVVKKIRNDVQQVFANNKRRNAVAQNISQQFENCEYQKQRKKCGDDHRQIDEEVAHHVVIQDHRKAGAEETSTGGSAGKGVFGLTGP